ncbi:RagB/SusD family nutrient uptake outer membrane protein [Kaistella anthropi]|nr:RagB/SusD family nutrient uptake outer membrane protein [Kaistella anthropi]
MTPSNEFSNAMYYRLYTEIAFCNEFIKNTTDEKLNQNGISGANLDEAKVMRAEAQFLRAQAYYHLLDLYGNVPFVDETTFGSVPQQMKRSELFTYVENQLKDAEAGLKDPKPTNTEEQIKLLHGLCWQDYI